MKKVLIFLFVVIGCVFTVSAKEKKKYLALGDSITYGYSMEDPSTQNYAYLFANKCNLDYTNLAVSGDTSSDLLEILNRTDISDYDVISVCIGANDVLGIVVEAFNELDTTNLDLSSIATKINEMTSTEEFEQKIDTAVANFRINFAKILTKLKATDAKLYVLNVYNPYKSISLGGVNVLADGYVSKINSVIEESKEEFNFVDVYKDFNDSDKNYINANLLLMNIDPHPNMDGQKRISRLLENAYVHKTLLPVIIPMSVGIIALVAGSIVLYKKNKKRFS